MEQAPRSGLLTTHDIIALVRLSRTSIYRMTRQGRFPPPCSVGNGKIRWREDDVRAWMAGLTVDRAITVMDSHDRMLNSASLFYVLSSRAREHLGLHVDSKSGLAEAVGKHRGDMPHAHEVAHDVRPVKGAKRESSTETPPLDTDRSPGLALQIELGSGRKRAFEIGL